MVNRINSKKIISGVMAMVMVAGMSGCGQNKNDKSDKKNYDSIRNTGSGNSGGMYENECGDIEAENCIDGGYVEDFNTNEFTNITENSWNSVKNAPLSTFAADVDTASYSTIRNMIVNGYDVDQSAVRIEEMINYFHYDYDNPKEDEKFNVYTEYMDCPWNDDTKLAMVALNTMPIDFTDMPKQNLVFLIDTSGSMFDEDKLPLVQKSLCMLAENLTENDRVSVVTYAGSDEVVLEGVSGDKYYEISSAIENLEAHGSTNGSAGINTAYEIAEKYFIEGGNNRVILATDGDLNVGVTSEGALEKLITEKKKSGVFLSVLGFGYGNLKDNKMETLADKGNGNYAYIDSIFEAKKALVDNMGGSLVTVAKDVKLQVEFNPQLVKGYRLIGYENRVMNAQDFNDDTKDGGEMGAGHSVTALYEIIPSDSKFEIEDIELKYSDKKAEVADEDIENNENKEFKADIASEGDATDEYGDELFTVSVRYKEVDSDVSSKESYVCTKSNYIEEGSDNLRWAAAVAGFGMKIIDSKYMKKNDPDDIILSLALSTAYDEDPYRSEFIDLVTKYFETY